MFSPYSHHIHIFTPYSRIRTIFAGGSRRVLHVFTHIHTHSYPFTLVNVRKGQLSIVVWPVSGGQTLHGSGPSSTCTIVVFRCVPDELLGAIPADRHGRVGLASALEALSSLYQQTRTSSVSYASGSCVPPRMNQSLLLDCVECSGVSVPSLSLMHGLCGSTFPS